MDSERITPDMGGILKAEMENEDSTSTPLPEAPAKKGWRFWAIFFAICVTTMLAAVESTVTSTALPSIVHELEANELYVWFVNAYFLASTASLPLIGQFCDIFGRRWMMIGVVALFALGSGISGGATSSAMLIGGRAVQGVGGGGINLLIEVVVSDLVPLRERGTIMGIIFAIFALGTSIGPFVGGAIVQRSSWRWVFYINLPISGVALVLHFLFLRVNYNKEATALERLRMIDYGGNFILTGSVVSVLLALSWGGALYAWSSYQIIVPLVLGILGLGLFHWYETMPWVKAPALPERVFKRRTPAAALLIAFVGNVLLFWVIYFLPIFFQAVLGMSPMIAGVALLPTSLFIVLVAAVAGGVVTKTGRYRPLHIGCFCISSLGLGLYSRFNTDTSTAEWVLVQLVASLGLGMLMSTTLPAVQADLPESDMAAATAAFAFMRAYGAIWGVSIPAAIFNAKFATEAWRIGDPSVEQALAGGRAYEFAAADFILSFPETTRGAVRDVYARSLSLTWYVSIGFAVLGLLLAFMEKEIVLRTTLDTKFGLEQREKDEQLASD